MTGTGTTHGHGRANVIALLAAAIMFAAALLAAAFALTTGGTTPARAADQAGRATVSPTRDILAVSNNWDGTVDLVDPHSFRRLKRVNIVPDRAQRVAEIQASPDRLAFFLAIRQQIGEGHDQLADDAFTSPDGRFLYVSRPSFADVVSISLKTGRIVWRVPVAGYRSDHMAISANGRRLLVSASTANVVQVINTARGRIVDQFESGDSPAREQLLQGRQADLPRQHRARVHTARPGRVRHQ